MNTIKKIPSSIVQLFCRIGSYIVYDLGLDFKLGAAKKHNFGFGVITNITSMNMDDVTPPFVPFCKGVFVLAMCTPVFKPTVIENKLINRNIMRLNFTLDNRFTDVLDLNVIVKKLREVLRDFEKYIG